MRVLTVENLGINFGGLRAVDNFNLTIDDDVLYGLIGPNGAGKTTVFNMLTGVYAPTDWKIYIGDVCLNHKTPHEINNLGIARTFQNIRLFKDMTVLENIKVALDQRDHYSFFDALFKTKNALEKEKQIEEEALALLKVFKLEAYKDLKASNLPYGKQRELEIARALGCKPRLLLLDEPAAGMNPQETLELMNTIKEVKEQFKIAILLIEHDMKLVKGICQRVTVLNYGRILAEGKTEEVLNNPLVIKAYLGE